MIEVTKPNMAQKGIVKISKTGEVFATVIEAEGMFQPVYQVQGLPGAVYEIAAAEDIYTLDGTLRYSAGEVVDTITIGDDGTAQSQPLYLGKFTVKEIEAPFGMVLNEEIHTVELVYAGQEVEITETATSFYNERQKAAVSLDKVLERDDTFHIGTNGSILPAGGLLEILSLNENGQAACKTDLPFGNYYLKELSTDGHYLLNDAEYPIVFEYAGQEVALVEIKANDGAAIENMLLRGPIQGMKKDEAGNGLGGALIGLFSEGETEFTADTAILTATSAQDGSFAFSDVPYGNWLVKELESPTGFVLSDEVFSAVVDADGVVIEIEIANQRVYGSIRLTKVDKDYPDNKLTGAEFALYRDSNGDKKLDEGDELLGTLEEVSTGMYEKANLVYGGYLVKETKSPEGFYLDENAYYVEIAENGKIYEVENEAGKGFVNAARVGSLKIVKTSSDGKVEGFSFRVTGPHGYDQTFQTDKNGEITIEGLRIGDYVVSELSDSHSSGYVLPEDKTAAVKENATTIVKMHNEEKDTPKTGDSRNPALWLVMLGVSAAGAAACGFLAFKKRKKEDE